MITLNVEQAASAMNLSTRTVRRMIESGEIEATFVGRQYQISIDTIKALMGVPPHSLPYVPSQLFMRTYNTLEIHLKSDFLRLIEHNRRSDLARALTTLKEVGYCWDHARIRSIDPTLHDAGTKALQALRLVAIAKTPSGERFKEGFELFKDICRKLDWIDRDQTLRAEVADDAEGPK